MIKLMDSLLREVDIKFDFTAYRVLACSKDDGIMEFVPSVSIQEIGLDNNHDVSTYL
jgi:phosphatidylinositol kinase/protein kinase (PI-3  family)